MIYKIGKKKYKTWDEYDEALRNIPEEDLGEEVKFKMFTNCEECGKLIKGKKYHRTIKQKIRGKLYFAFVVFCQKCHGKLYHIKSKNGGKKLST